MAATTFELVKRLRRVLPVRKKDDALVREAADRIEALEAEVATLKRPIEGAACIHRGQFIDFSNVCQWCRAERAEEQARQDLDQVRDDTGRVPIRHVTFEDGPGLTWEQAADRERAAREQAEAMVAALRERITAKCAQYWNEPYIGPAEVHAALEFIADSFLERNARTAAAEHDARVRREALEEAAKICERYEIEAYHEAADSTGMNKAQWLDRSNDAKRIAAAIRAPLPPDGTT